MVMVDPHTKTRVKYYSFEENNAHKIKLTSTTEPLQRPDFEQWCKDLHVSRLHNRADGWLEINSRDNKNF